MTSPAWVVGDFQDEGSVGDFHRTAATRAVVSPGPHQDIATEPAQVVGSPFAEDNTARRLVVVVYTLWKRLQASMFTNVELTNR